MPAARRLTRHFLLGCSIVLVAACTPNRNLEFTFAAIWQGEPISCDGTSSKDKPVLTDLRFFVSDLIAVDAAGKQHAIVLSDEGGWQQTNLAFVDLENGVGGCENGSSPINDRITGRTTAADIAKLRLTVGVPFALNHANPLTAVPPLDDAAMHWHWRSGYKFLRAGVATESDGFWLHLGSTGCEGTVQNISSCSTPNRVTVDIESADQNIERIGVDLAFLFSDIDLMDGTPGNCSSGPAETECDEPMRALSERPQEIFQVLP